MSDHAAYRAAIEPHARRAERERKVITHVRWRDGHADVTMISKKKHEAQSCPPEPSLL